MLDLYDHLGLIGLKRMTETFAGIFSSRAQFLFNAHDLVVFGQPFRAARSASFNLKKIRKNQSTIPSKAKFLIKLPGQ